MNCVDECSNKVVRVTDTGLRLIGSCEETTTSFESNAGCGYVVKAWLVSEPSIVRSNDHLVGKSREGSYCQRR